MEIQVGEASRGMIGWVDVFSGSCLVIGLEEQPIGHFVAHRCLEAIGIESCMLPHKSGSWI